MDQFEANNKRNILELHITRTWYNREHNTQSKEWKVLRNAAQQKHNNTCRFCGIKLSKYLICDHIDGNASNNNMDNLGINCPGCDRIRHCGFYGGRGDIILMISKMQQIDIVKATHAFYLKHNRIPVPTEIDPKCKVPDINIVEFANLLLEHNRNELIEEIIYFKGFFAKDIFKYLQFIV